MSKNSKSIIGLGLSFITVTIGAVIGVIKYEEKKHNDHDKELDILIGKAKAELDNLHEGVKDAVCKVYNEEARQEFSSSLKKVNVEAMAERYCENSVKALEDSTIRKVLKDGYSSKADKLVKEELQKYFSEGIRKYVDGVVDEESVRRLTRKYTNDHLEDVVEKTVEDKVTKDDIKEAIESYIRHNKSECNYILRSALAESLREEDKVGREILDYIKDEFDSNSFLTEAIDEYLDRHSYEIESILFGKGRR